MPQSVKEQALGCWSAATTPRRARAKLVEKGAGPEEAAAVAGRMVELGYVNDANYASMVARHYAARGFGPGRVRDELRRRRVPREYWDDALGQLPDDGEAAYRCLCAGCAAARPLRESCARPPPR